MGRNLSITYNLSFVIHNTHFQKVENLQILQRFNSLSKRLWAYKLLMRGGEAKVNETVEPRGGRKLRVGDIIKVGSGPLVVCIDGNSSL